MPAVVGVDGCWDGWFYLHRDSDAIRSGVAGDFAGLVEGLPSGAWVFLAGVYRYIYRVNGNLLHRATQTICTLASKLPYGISSS